MFTIWHRSPHLRRFRHGGSHGAVRRNAFPGDIGQCDTFVQQRAGAGHGGIRPYASLFKVVGSTSSVNARDHVGATGDVCPSTPPTARADDAAPFPRASAAQSSESSYPAPLTGD